MTKEQMADQTTERKTSLPNEREVVDFVSSGIDGLSDSMARYSVSPTPDALLRVQEAVFEVEGDAAIAKALSAVEVTDPNFSRLDTSEEGITDAYAITLAKAKVAEAEVQDGKAKQALRNFGNRILSGAGSAVAGIGGKKALTATAGLSLVAAACGPLIGPGPKETPAAPRTDTTEFAPVPTEEPVGEAISWEEIRGNIDDFLNRTPEMMFETVEEERRLFRSPNGGEILPIGFYEYRQSPDSERLSVEIQGVLLGFTEPSKDQVISYIGLENHSTHERIVVPFSTWPFVEGGSAFAFKESAYPPALETADAVLLRGNNHDLVSWLTPLLNHPVVLSFEVDKDLSEPSALTQENEWAYKVNGNAVKLFDWLGGKLVTAPTYNLENPTAEDVIHNNFYVLSYPQVKPDLSVTIETTPAFTATPEPTATPEGYLAPEKIQELASSFLCNDESCVREVYRQPNFLDFDFISSGVFQEIDLTNPKTGESLGRGVVLKAVSKDKNDNPFIVNILVQLEPVDNPGYNYLYGAAWTLIVAGRQNMDFIGDKPLSADEWSRVIPEGETYEIVLLKRRAPDSDRISSDPVTRDLYYLFYDSPDYQEALKAFYESNGEEVDENLILFISGSTDNTPQIVTTP